MPQAANTKAASSSSLNGTGGWRLRNASGPSGMDMPNPKRRERRSRKAESNGYDSKGFMWFEVPVHFGLGPGPGQEQTGQLVSASIASKRLYLLSRSDWVMEPILI